MEISEEEFNRYNKFFTEVYDMYQHARKVELRKILAKHAKDSIKKDFEKYNNIAKLFNVGQSQNVEGKKGKNYMFFVTISFRDDLSLLPKALEVTLKFCKRKFVKKYYMVFEQRGDTEQTIKGVHTHFLMEADIKPCILNKYLKEAYKDLCDVNNKRFIDIKTIIPEFWNDKVEYMKGNKTDESKKNAVAVNEIFRKKYNINTYYTDAGSL